MKGQRRGGLRPTLGDTGLNGYACGRRTQHGGPRRPADQPPVNVAEAAPRRGWRCHKEAAGTGSCRRSKTRSRVCKRRRTNTPR